MKLIEYVNKYFEGNKAAFGRAFNRLPQNVTKLFKNPEQWIIIIDDDHHTLAQIRVVRSL